MSAKCQQLTVNCLFIYIIGAGLDFLQKMKRSPEKRKVLSYRLYQNKLIKLLGKILSNLIKLNLNGSGKHFYLIKISRKNCIFIVLLHPI